MDVKKLYQQYYTPTELASYVVSLADIKEGERVLEPSAGNGALIKQMPITKITAVEIDEKNIDEIRGIDGIEVIHGDFLEFSGREFDKIVMNPPFTRSQDVRHILHAYSLLADGGKLISIASS